MSPTKEKYADGYSSRGLMVFSRVFAFVVGGLILMGALVTSHDAGLAVPDWPSSFGENMFLYPPSKWKGIIFYEHFHRLYASVVGLLTIVLVVWTLKVDRRRWVKLFSLLALGAVIIQGLLGGLTVIYLLPTAVSSAHGILGQTFFVLSLIIAFSHSFELRSLTQKSFSVAERATGHALFRMLIGILTLVYLQLFVAAVMRHSGAGLAYVDFPTFAGQWLPRFTIDELARANELRTLYRLSPVELFHLVFHALHRLLAYVILIVVYMASWRVIKKHDCPDILKSTFFLLSVIVSLQLMLGIATVASVRSPWVTSFHVLGGALLLVFSALGAVRAWVISRKAFE
jgi:cytochrome c oxidase assembly protein subunit 15